MVKKAKRINPPTDMDNALSLAESNLSLARISSAHELISDAQSVAIMQQHFTQGSSLRSLAMLLGLPVTILNTWIENGKQDFEAGEVTHFSALYRMIQICKGEAVSTAEAALLKKNPQAWLEKFSGEESSPPGTPVKGTVVQPGMTKTFGEPDDKPK